MRWQGRRESNNVEDRRGQSLGGGGGRMRIPLRGKSGLLLIVVVLVAGYFGVDLTPFLTGGADSGLSSSSSYSSSPPSAEEEEMAKFSSVVLASTEDVWQKKFSEIGQTYRQPKLVLYTGATSTTCGYGQAAMGPFYCPADQTVYIDLAFYQDMKTQLGGGGDFAQAYVIAHEVGHHVQNLLGIEKEVRKQQAKATDAEVNHLSVKMELQADCLAGVWGQAMDAEGALEMGDMEEALRTAEAIGDDRLQKQSGGQVVPDSFTHGSSEQRYTWFKRGFDSGDMKGCNTFAAGQ